MTPPLPLTELVKKWRDEAAVYPVDTWGGVAAAAQTAARLCADELESALAALPIGRCETCREWQDIASAPRGSHKMILLHAPYSQRGPVDYGYHDIGTQEFMVQTMIGWEPLRNFDITGKGATHWMPLPAPPAAGEETRDGK